MTQSFGALFPAFGIAITRQLSPSLSGPLRFERRRTCLPARRSVHRRVLQQLLDEDFAQPVLILDGKLETSARRVEVVHD